jgi:wobble nucleotide-excising tRNase
MYEKKIMELRSKIGRHECEIDDLEYEIRNLQDVIEETEEEIGTLEAQLTGELPPVEHPNQLKFLTI